MWATQRPRSRFAPPAQRILPATEQHVNANWPHGSARMSVGMSLLRSDRRTKRSAVSRLHGMKLFFRFRDKNGFPFYFAFRVLSTSLGHLCLGIGLADEVRQEENIFPQIEGRDTVLWKRFQQDHETKNTAWKFSHFSLKKNCLEILHLVARLSTWRPERQHMLPHPWPYCCSHTGPSAVSQTGISHSLYANFTLFNCWWRINGTKTVFHLPEALVSLLIRAWRIQNANNACLSECTSVLKTSTNCATAYP